MLEAAERGCGGKWLRTPAGWARAKIWYAKLGRPPRPGTWQEVLAILVVLGESELDVAKTRVLVQAARQAKSTTEDFAGYIDAAFPYRKRMQDDVKEQQRKVLEQWTEMGKIPIRPKERDDPQRGMRERMREKGRQVSRRPTVPGPLPEAWTTPPKPTRSVGSTASAYARVPVKLRPAHRPE